MSPGDTGPSSCQAFAPSLPRPACWCKPRTRLHEQRVRLKWQFLFKGRGEKAREVMLTDVTLGTDAINDYISFPGLPLPVPINQVARNDRGGFPRGSGGQKSETEASHKGSWEELLLPTLVAPGVLGLWLCHSRSVSVFTWDFLVCIKSLSSTDTCHGIEGALILGFFHLQGSDFRFISGHSHRHRG